MMKEKLKFGLIGAGGIAQAYAQVFADYDLARIVAVADVRKEASEALAEELHCHSFYSHKALAEACDLDAVIICTPPATHPEIALHFLERRVHVLCEKPLSIDVKSAHTMLDAARRQNVTLTMASKFRYVEDVVRAKSIVTSGILGEIILFENAFTSHVDMSSRWNSNPALSGGGVLIDNGTHSVDLMRYFLGPLAEVQVVEGKRCQGLDVEETIRIFVRSQMGVIGNIDLSWNINKELDRYLSIYGSHGTVLVGWKESKYRQAGSNEWIVFGHGYDKLQAFRNQINNFCRSLTGEEALRITAEDALASVEVVEAAYAALRQSQWTSINRSVRLDGQREENEVIEAPGIIA
ncbi:MAG TPA: Gfo/Idh/MocA family oxidoreductase [Pyrinomonadaceae bacterium]|jgi:predicted dehydrogenase